VANSSGKRWLTSGSRSRPSLDRPPAFRSPIGMIWRSRRGGRVPARLAPRDGRYGRLVQGHARTAGFGDVWSRTSIMDGSPSETTAERLIER